MFSVAHPAGGIIILYSVEGTIMRGDWAFFDQLQMLPSISTTTCGNKPVKTVPLEVSYHGDPFSHFSSDNNHISGYENRISRDQSLIN